MKNNLINLFFLLSILFFSKNIHAQLENTSNLPIIVIETEDEIPDEPKIEGTMGIIFNGENQENNIDDAFNHYDGNIAIETRGNSTQGFEKKTYSLELRNAQNEDSPMSLLGMGEEEDWILHAMVIDKTQLRIPMSFYLFQKMGHYAANWRYVELIVNEEYQGLYILTEKIKRDDSRVDIAKMTTEDTAGDEVTGGYILRIDWLDEFEEGESGFFSQYESQAGDIPMIYQWYYPKAENIQPQQVDYIEEYMYQFESAVFADDFHNASGTRYTDYININSFTDFLLINEVSKNSDGYKLSSYLHKDRDSNNGKLTAGPIWDFDQTYGVSLVCSCHEYTGWTYLQNQDGCEDLESMPMWWQAMMSDEQFLNHLKCRWETLRAGVLHTDSMMTWIDTHRDLISEAKDRNFERWDYFIGEHIWIEPEPIPETYEEEIAVLKEWIENRLEWIDENLGGNCADDVFLGIKNENVAANSIEIVPNPTQNSLKINTKTKIQAIIFNINGQKIYESLAEKTVHQIDVSTWPKGIYFVSMKGDNLQQTQKIIVE